MAKKALAVIAVFLLAAMALHGVAHAAAPDGDSCAACAVSSSRTTAPSAPRVVAVRSLSSDVQALPTPSPRPGLAPQPVARPPPRG